MLKLRTNQRKSDVVIITMDELAQSKAQAELELKKLRELYQKSILEFSNATKSYDETIERLIEEKEIIEITKEKYYSQIKDLKYQNDSLNSLILSLKSEISEKDAKIDAIQSYNKKSLAEQLIKENVQNLYDRIEGDKKRFNDFSKTLRKEKNDAFQKNIALQADIQKHLKDIEDYDLNLKQSEVKNDEIMAKYNYVKQKIQVSKIDSDIAVELYSVQAQALEIESNLFKNLDFLIKFSLDLSQKYLFQQRLITKIFKFVQDKDCEICILKNKIFDEQAVLSIYIPEKSDNIDLAMADYINTRPQFLEVQFIRIDRGVYLFGTKVVKVKLQNNKLIMCMGGGFMSIDEFITLFTPMELEKMNERKKFDQVSQMRGLVNDSLVFLGNDEPISPIFPPGGQQKTKKPENSMSSNNFFRTSSRENSIGSLSSSLLMSQGKRGVIRKSSTITKF